MCVWYHCKLCIQGCQMMHWSINWTLVSANICPLHRHQCAANNAPFVYASSQCLSVVLHHFNTWKFTKIGWPVNQDVLGQCLCSQGQGKKNKTTWYQHDRLTCSLIPVLAINKNTIRTTSYHVYFCFEKSFKSPAGKTDLWSNVKGRSRDFQQRVEYLKSHSPLSYRLKRRIKT